MSQPAAFVYPRTLSSNLQNPSLPFVTPEMYGAKGDGTTDDATAFNNALVAAATVGCPVFTLSKTYKINSTLTFDVSKTCLQGSGGTTFDFSGIGSSTAFNIFTTWADPNTMTGQHIIHPVCNFRMIGPSANGVAFSFTPSIIFAAPWITGTMIEKIAVTGFEVCIDLPAGAVLNVFRDIVFGSTSGISSGWFIRYNGGANVENILFDRCFCVNIDGVYLEQAGNVNNDMTFSFCSFDGITYLATGGTVGAPGTSGITAQIFIFGGHWEPDRFTDYLVWVAQFGLFKAEFIQFIGGTPGPLHVPFKSDATNQNAGIIIRDINLNTLAWTNNTICDGTGNFQINGSAVANSYGNLNFSLKTNRVPSYTFPTSGSLTTNWTGSPTYDTSTKPTGAAGSADISGGTASMFTTPCLPGQIVQAQAQIKFSSPGSGDTVSMTVDYADSGGNELAGESYIINTAQDFAEVTSALGATAPPGTVSARVIFKYNASGGGASVWFALPQVAIL